MKIAFLILAHQSPNHLYKLVRSLRAPDAKCFVHLDQKSDVKEFVAVLEEDNVFLTKRRLSVYWGDFSVVEATLVLIREALSCEEKFDRFVLMSGEDYPLQTVEYIRQFFIRNDLQEFIDFSHSSGNSCELMRRLAKFRPYSKDSRFNGIFRSGLARLGLFPWKRDYRKYLHYLTPFGGTTWWALTRNAVVFVNDFVIRNPGIAKFYRHTLMADEMIFQTILGNSHFRSRISPTVTYADWRVAKTHPPYISEKHLPIFEPIGPIMIQSGEWKGKGELLFARKFSDDSVNVVEQLDQFIRRRSNLFI